MNNYLSNALTRHLETHQLSAVEFERRAGLPGASVSRIHTGRHPRPETMSAILSSVPTEDARRLLLAYLRDDCPDDWEQRIILDIASPSSVVREEMPSPTAPARPQIEAAIEALAQAAEGDSHLREWLIDTARLLNLTE
jgi:hypothetical protein